MEVLPWESLLLPLHSVVVNLLAGGSELAAHAHEEGVEDVDRRAAGLLDEAAVEASAELRQLVVLLGRSPENVQLIAAASELLASIQRVVSVRLRLVPRDTEMLLKLVIRDVKLRWLQQCRLGGDRVVVLIDQLLLVDDI